MDELHALTRVDQVFADRILHYTGKEEDEDLKQMFAYVLASARAGHLCVEERELFDAAKKGLEKFKASGLLFGSFLRAENGRVYLEKNWVLEHSIIDDILRLTEPRSPIDTLCLPSKFTLNDEQENAVKTAICHPLTLLTGGPGTGKTYTAAAIVNAFISQGDKKVILTAPTGRAADHLAKNIEKWCSRQMPSGTLHRILQVKRPPPWPKEDFQLNADLLIVDESSMIDAALFATLLKAIPKGCTTVLIGDPNQLSPVGIGSVFSDLVSSTRLSIAKAHLKHSLRTENREILDLSSSILQGKILDSFVTPWPATEKELFGLLQGHWTFEPSQGKPEVGELFKRLAKFRLLSSLRQGPYGSEAVNRWFFDEIQKSTPHGSWWWAPIMVTRNDERTNLSNGEVGIYVERKGDWTSGEAYFQHHADGFPMIALPSWEFAFCTSVHKSQGSEYDEVLVLLPQGSESFGREMLYTSITRAKKKVSLLAAPIIVEAMVKRSFKKISGII